MNIWLSEYIDLELASYLNRANVENVFIHGGGMGKFSQPLKKRPLSPLDGLNDQELKSYSNEKKAWNLHCQKNLRLIFELECQKLNISTHLGTALERLFFHCSQGCMDALMFVKSFDLQNSSEEINIVVGENYRLTEFFGLFWWLSLIQSSTSSRLRIYYSSRSQKFREIRSLSEIGAKDRLNPILKMDHLDDFEVGDEEFVFMWGGGIRFPFGWDSLINQYFGSEPSVLRFSELGCSHYHRSPCVELQCSSNFSKNEIENHLNDVRAIWGKRVFATSKSDHVVGADVSLIEEYFRKVVVPNVVARVADLVHLLEKNIGRVRLKGFFSSMAPFVESIALHEFCRRRNILPYLLPHSWTASYEYPPESYEKTFTFISSSDLVPTSHLYDGSLEKEELISLNKVESEHRFHTGNNLSPKTRDWGRLKQIIQLPLLQKVRMLRQQCLDRLYSYVDNHKRMRLLNSPAHKKIGLLLNYEQYEFTVGLSFNDLFNYIEHLYTCMDKVFAGGAMLYIRRKIGWTNPYWLRASIEDAKNVALCPKGSSLLDYGSKCDVVLFIQGTSAVPELIMNGTPCIKIREKGEALDTMSDYITFPNSIVPELTCKETLYKISTEPHFLSETLLKQQVWIKSHLYERT